MPITSFIRPEIDWEFPSWQTITNLMHDIPQSIVDSRGRPGPDAWIERHFRLFMHQACSTYKAAYANPLCVVEAEDTCEEFYRLARKGHHQWRNAFRKTMGWTSSKWYREIQQVTPIMRQLQFIGVLIIDSRHIHPGNWPQEMTIAPPKHLLVGEQFGLLTAERWLGHNSWLCRCACGKKKTVREEHLLSDATKSCGCLNTNRKYKWLSALLTEIGQNRQGHNGNNRHLAGGLQKRPIIASHR